MKFILISPKNRTAYNFRGDLVKRIIAAGYEVIVTGPNMDNVDKIEELGARFELIPIDKNGVNPIHDLKYMNALRKLFKREKPDVTLGYTSKPVIYGSIAARLAKVPFNSANVVIFQNDDDKEQFVGEKLVKAQKCTVVNGSGVNTEKFAVAPYPEQTTFFMLSRVMYSKGIREYLEACRIVKAKHPEVRCMLLGACEGIQDSISPEALKEYTDSGIIEHFGETDTVADYYKQCSVYVLPSYREGTPRTVLEAMSMGRAVITTDAPGCRGTVIDGETGYLVPVKDAEAVAEKMIDFIEHPEKIATMGAASAKYCREKYDVEKVNGDMCKYLCIKE